MLTECIKNVLGFSRKKVIEICNYILWWLGDWLYEYINVTQESVSCLDFKIFGRNNASVCCHSTILMLALPLMRHLLCDESCLILPDFSLEELKSFVKLLYGGGNRFIYWLNIGAKWKRKMKMNSYWFVSASKAVQLPWRKLAQYLLPLDSLTQQ